MVLVPSTHKNQGRSLELADQLTEELVNSSSAERKQDGSLAKGAGLQPEFGPQISLWKKRIDSTELSSNGRGRVRTHTQNK